jgi:hypothetical protein
MLDYVDARFVMDRLDTMAGPQNWQTKFEDVAGGGVRCSLSIKVMGEWITKTDVGDASTIEPIKGAHSDSLKRAAVHWGIGRDLYDTRAEESAPAPVSRPPAYAQPAAAPAGYAQPPALPVPGGVSGAMDPRINPTGWLCPIHGSAAVQPAGTNKRTGQPYAAFLKCGSGGPPYCNEKPPRAVAAPVAAPAAPEYDPGDTDPLPF